MFWNVKGRRRGMRRIILKVDFTKKDELGWSGLPVSVAVSHFRGTSCSALTGNFA